MDSDTVTDCKEVAVTRPTDEATSAVEQVVEGIEARADALGEKITMCLTVLNDLQDLKDVVERKSLQDVPIPPQK